MSDTDTVGGLPYQTYMYSELRKIIDPRGKVVLEIGSDVDLIFSRHLADDGASRIVASNQEKWASSFSQDKIPPSIELAAVDARHTQFEDNTFDLITGIAFLEHINDFRTFRDEMLRILKPGGMAFLQGGAFYSCFQGHHVCFFPPDPDYHFWDDTNPFQPWEHLLYDRDKMAKRFSARGISDEYCQEIVSQVYDSDLINRLSPSQMVNILNEESGSKLFYKRDMLYTHLLSNESMHSIIGRHGFSPIDLYTYAARTVLIKGGIANDDYSNFIKDQYLDADYMEAAEANSNNMLAFFAVDDGSEDDFGYKQKYLWLLESRSWQVTAPLRKISTLMKGNSK